MIKTTNGSKGSGVTVFTVNEYENPRVWEKLLHVALCHPFHLR